MPDPNEIRALFARIAPRYDRANHCLSFGVDRWWRRAAVQTVAPTSGTRALDVCAGTGDLALALSRTGARVTATDFCPQMLRLAHDKARRRGPGRPRFLAADALELPFAAGAFDLAAVAFGIRNVRDPVAALREMARVVRPGGWILVLEFSRPRLPVLGALYLLYFRRVLPRLGGWIAGDRHGAYAYLQESALRFPERDAFTALMREAGLESPRFRVLTCGIATAYRAQVPA